MFFSSSDQQSCLCSSLSVNGITSQGGRCLAEALQHNSVLRIFWLVISGQTGSNNDDSIRAIDNKLVCVCGGGRLVQNEFTDEVAPHLAELIRANTGLSHLW